MYQPRKLAMKKQLYINEKQKAFLQAKQKTRVFVGGRGTGKSTEIGFIARMKAAAMPGGKIFFASTTYNQILTKTLPAIEKIWMDMGMKDGIHYVVGIRPPKHFQKPYSPPRKYQNVISFINGFCIEMISMDRPDLARGGSYDGGEIDEVALIKREDFTRVLMPSIRGNIHRFGKSHWHQNVNLYTSIPWKSSGYWIFDFEQKAKDYPTEYFYLESTAYDNIHILTKEGIDRLEREMDWLEFQIEVLNKRILKVPDGFYHKFDNEHHVYQPKYNYEDWTGGIRTTGQSDLKDNELLEMSFDFSGWFNCCTIYQERNNTEYMVKQMHVKGDNKLQDLIKNICNEFIDHKFKYVRIWGEPRGHDKQPMTKTIYESIGDLFTANGWTFEVCVRAGRTNNHAERHLFVNELLIENNQILPLLRINQDNCKDVIIAIQSTQVTPDFKKDKAKEKDRKFPQEHAPHYTDTVDYYLIQKHGWKVQQHHNQRAGEIMIM